MSDDIFDLEATEEEDGALAYATDVITLTDEDGVDHEFELVDTAEFNGNTYVALMVSAKDDPQGFLDADGELIIMKADLEEDGDQYLALIEDDDEYDSVADFFMERLSDQYDFGEI